MLETLSTTGSLPSIEKLDSIARKTGLIRRSSTRFSAHGFLLSLIQSVLRGNNSLNHLATGLGQFEQQSMSRQAMHQRLDEASSRFLLRVLGELMKNRTLSLITHTQKTSFKRLLIEDCTVLPMHKSNHKIFPGNGNGKNLTSGAKVHLLGDWLSGDILECALHTARSADQGLSGEVLHHVREKDLIVRDMGFFHLDTLRQIEAAKAFWISRLPASISGYDVQGTPLDTLLKNHRRNRLEMTIYLGSREQKRCRLLATRLSPLEVEKNRCQRRRNAKKHGATASRRGLLRDEWSILVTNLTDNQADAKLLHHIYSLRWSIEIQFRGMKQSCRLEKTFRHKADHYQMEALLLAAMIYQVLTLKIHSELRKHIIKTKALFEISYEKLCDALASHLTSMTKHTRKVCFKPDFRHLSHDKRKRPTLYAMGIQSLT